MLNATVIGREEVTDYLVIYYVKPDIEIPDFLPGQYVALGLLPTAARPSDFPAEEQTFKPDRLIKRSYSIGSSPMEKEHFEFYIAILPEGALTSRFALLNEGDRLFAQPKIVGTFTLEGTPDDSNLILVSTGTGIAPYISMLRSESTWNSGRHITLLHGVRYPCDLGYRDEMLKLAESRDNFSYHLTISRADESWEGDKGYVQEYLKNGTVNLNPQKDHVFLCGNPAMIEDVEKMLTEKEYSVHSRRNPGNLHLEKYW